MADAPAYPDLTDTDLAFVVAQTAPDSANPARLAALVREDPDFRKAMIGDERVLEGVLNDEEVFLKVSTALYFEVLLRGSLKELETAAYTVERSGRSSIPVFDTSEVTELLMRDGIIEYLAHMLTSFTKINSYVVPVRVRPGVRRRIRYNDMDVDSLIALCEKAGDHERFAFYKRIADVCLFTSGVFPGYARLHPGTTRKRVFAGPSRRAPGRLRGQPHHRGLRNGGAQVLPPRRRAPGGPPHGPHRHLRPTPRKLHLRPQAPRLHRLTLPPLQAPQPLRPI